jgi:hypothetical protein
MKEHPLPTFAEPKISFYYSRHLRHLAFTPTQVACQVDFYEVSLAHDMSG